jgi:chemotaxis protein methyltransferase CheR
MPAKVKPAPRPPQQAARPVPLAGSAGKLPAPEQKAEIEELIGTGRYTEAIQLAEKYVSLSEDRCDTLCLLAHAYASSGAYAKAETACREAIKIDADSAEPYFLLAQIAEAGGNDQEAKNLFRKALYLNPDFVAAYCELGGLYEKENDQVHARKARTTALELLRSLPPQAPVKPYDATAEELLKCVEYLIGPEPTL